MRLFKIDIMGLVCAMLNVAKVSSVAAFLFFSISGCALSQDTPKSGSKRTVEIATIGLIDPEDSFMDLKWKVPTYEDGSQYVYFYRYDPPCLPKPPIPFPDEDYFYPSFGDQVCLNPGFRNRYGPVVTIAANEELDIRFVILGWPDNKFYPGEPHGIVIQLGEQKVEVNRGADAVEFNDVRGSNLDLKIWIEGIEFIGSLPLTKQAPYLLPAKIVRK